MKGASAFTPPAAGVDAVLAGSAYAYRDRPALCDGDLTLTFSELLEQSRAFAMALRELGVLDGDVVMLAMPSSAWYVVAYYGVLLARGTAFAVNPVQPVEALRELFTEYRSTVLITHPGCANVLEASPAAMTRIIVEPTSAAPVTNSPGDSVSGTRGMASMIRDAGSTTLLPCEPRRLAHLQLTGGTSGRSKAVRILHSNIVANAIQSCGRRFDAAPVVDEHGVRLEAVPGARAAEYLGAGVMLQVAPFYHGAGLVGQSNALLSGTTTIFHGRFDPASYLRQIERHRVTRIAGTPALLHALLAVPEEGRADLSSVQVVFSGTAPIDTATLLRLGEMFPAARVTQGYGMSEGTCFTAIQTSHVGEQDALGGVGLPVAGTTVGIRDGGTGSVLLPGEVGEIFVSGPQLADGYMNQPELTAEQFVDGWLRTGDVGHLDERGELFIEGRSKDMLIYKGYNVYPIHLEEILAEHPGVDLCAVVGRPALVVGEVPVAFVVPHDPSAASEEFAEELIKFVAARVAPYQRIRELRFLDQMPRTDIGKVAKPVLSRLAEGDPLLCEAGGTRG